MSTKSYAQSKLAEIHAKHNFICRTNPSIRNILWCRDHEPHHEGHHMYFVQSITLDNGETENCDCILKGTSSKYIDIGTVHSKENIDHLLNQRVLRATPSFLYDPLG